MSDPRLRAYYHAMLARIHERARATKAAEVAARNVQRLAAQAELDTLRQSDERSEEPPIAYVPMLGNDWRGDAEANK